MFEQSGTAPWSLSQYAGYNAVTGREGLSAAPLGVLRGACRGGTSRAQPRRADASAVATEALQRWARDLPRRGAFAEMDHGERRDARQQLSKPLWDEFELWLKLQRTQVLDGSRIAEAIDATPERAGRR